MDLTVLGSTKCFAQFFVGSQKTIDLHNGEKGEDKNKKKNDASLNIFEADVSGRNVSKLFPWRNYSYC